ncbi:tripartite tricarboxylate transporter substrate binding protein [Pigmentiphaga sp. D-2]|uniref:Bug family tripartite tricarboxylate transporter substrate binding protein n=1 Tax=Pigmentiphaga sp. D-2 TaxID=1002116 RepID=UPI00104303E4|nr:tripartite tricarboxylate transporter substrate binding protein [Pigmentiphaga sp. D-2]
MPSPLRLAVAGVLALAVTLPAIAQDADRAWPKKPIRMIVPFTPGGSNDVLARSLSQHLGKTWGQPVVVENKPGAAGNIGAELVARAPSDGYTLLIAANNVMSVNPALYRLGFDPAKDFAPVSLLGTVPIVLVVNPSLPAKDVAQLVSYAKANPTKLNYASSGTGSPQHLSAELFNKLAGVRMTHVPYKGAAPATADVLAGQVQVLFAPINSVLPHIKSGKLRALAVAGESRAQLLPDVPTIAQAGYPAYRSDIWIALVAPAGTPADVVRQIQTETRNTLADPAVIETLAQQGIEAKSTTPDALRALAASDLARWTDVIKS